MADKFRHVGELVEGVRRCEGHVRREVFAAQFRIGKQLLIGQQEALGELGGADRVTDGAFPHDRTQRSISVVLPFGGWRDRGDQAGTEQHPATGWPILQEWDVLGIDEDQRLAGDDGREEGVEQRQLVAVVLDPVRLRLLLDQVVGPILQGLVVADPPHIGVEFGLAAHDPAVGRRLERMSGHLVGRRREMGVRTSPAAGVGMVPVD